MRTLDAFWAGQIKSKEWLIKNLEQTIPNPVSIDIHGGWVGVLASMLFQSNLQVTNIRSIDIDPMCEHTAITMNQLEYHSGRFKAITSNMVNIHSECDVVINTSCEHITQLDYNIWLNNMPKNSIIVLQSNNYDISEHIRTANSLDEFVTQSNLSKIIAKDKLTLPLYDRYMIIGFK